IYVHKGISTNDGVLKFRLRRFLFFTEIEAVGVKVI
ncbi:MAG TPA: CC/Se motif family (seleno)protein, partial [Bacillota bacterium]|nr:CC/Se motif family (seleno)protein [Bacillota bacterium]